VTKKSGGSAAPSQRQRRVGEVIKQQISRMLVRGDIHDDVLSRVVVTVSDVAVSPDLKMATIHVLPLGGGDIAPVIEALHNHRRYIRGEVARAINLKFAPDIRFRADDSFDARSRIDRLLDSPEVRRDTGARREGAARKANPDEEAS
jgi:ribosome-binding factor A